MLKLIQKIVGSKNDRVLKRIRPLIVKANAFEEEIQALDDEGLRGKTAAFRQRIAATTETMRTELDELRLLQDSEAREPSEANSDRDLRQEIDALDKAIRAAENEVLDDLLPEAFAVVREAARRAIGLRHYDVQLIGGTVLHHGKIAEMKTGEGKTLVATGGVYLNALTGRGVHVITVNDYLARRDVQWMGPVYHLLGLSCAAIVHDTSFEFDPTWVAKDYRLINLRPVERHDAYRADITYGTNHEFGFDYLRDNMKFRLEDYVQRELNYAIVDEVDNILIDEARTPLIISGPAEASTDKYYAINRVIPRLRKGIRIDKKGDTPAEESGDYWVDEKSRSAVLTEIGVSKVERLLNVTNLYDPNHIDLLHHVNQALKAHAIFRRDVDYIVKDGQVIIVDEFTGRLMPGRRWSDGLHQAVEAKEGVRIERENQTLATITLQNYFRMYQKLAGMTGTADTESVEFKNIYKLDVVVIPPNKKMSRTDFPDIVYKTEREKFDAVGDEVAACHEKGQPVLVGTVSVERSEKLSKALKRKGIRHNVLNAVNHEAEATVIAQAGRLGAVTIATNMAGRGTDILLGGNPEFLARSDMEDEWMKRSSNLPDGGSRFEEQLRRLRERFEEAVEESRQQYEPLWKPFEDSQAECLERLGTTHLDYLEAAFWTRKRELEQAIDAVNAADANARAAAVAAAEAYSEAMQEVDRVSGPFFGEEGRQRFLGGLGHLAEALGASGEEFDLGRFAKARDEFDRVRAEYERAVSKALRLGAKDQVDFESARSAYEDAERSFREAEASYQQYHQPYEEECARAQAEYESARRQVASAVESVREEMEKAPQQFQGRYEEILADYKKVCETERAQVLAAGGLHIIGTERHESRRIDNQLRGRAGRQGDPGSSRFYLSLEDDLLRIFGAERIQGLMERLGMEEGEPIEHRLITRAIANAQTKVEGRNFDMRKHLLEYDDVMNQQREIVYGRRREILSSPNLKADIFEMVERTAEAIATQYASDQAPAEEWDWDSLGDATFKAFNNRIEFDAETRASMTAAELAHTLNERAILLYQAREETFTPHITRQLEKFVMLQTLDAIWKDHLLSMDHLKEGISLRGYGQKNPLQEYKKEGFTLFELMMDQFHSDVVEKAFAVQIATQADAQKLERPRVEEPKQMVMSGGGSAPTPVRAAKTPARHDQDKVGRNDPCPCGSGKKYKKCHGS
jgi:preprotein translocase SecA subunit